MLTPGGKFLVSSEKIGADFCWEIPELVELGGADTWWKIPELSK